MSKVYISMAVITKLDLILYYVPGITSEWQGIGKNNFIKISQNEAIRVNFGFHIDDQKQFTHLNAQLNSYSAQITLMDVAGNESYTDIINLKDGRSRN